MKKISKALCMAILWNMLVSVHGTSQVQESEAAAGAPAGGGQARTPATASRSATQKAPQDEAEGLELRRQQLAEKEAALAAKEQELKKLTEQLDARIREINNTKKMLEDSLSAKRKTEAEKSGERYTKMLKLFKKLKPEESAKLVDKLDEDIAIDFLDRMDQKTAVKLIPHLNQPRVVKWVKENLQVR
ncbi:hypothetical protein [Geobacter sp. DSM 9736]|uniref:hypothetical protein n=1 Tax=Geobacter sp. DSM 9736 TaxID=1277350 RepID=UPI000B5F5060|nr:hypothetical protein [Geobacter sp. DSM 9736]SNB47057.1 hypothetical protein SAMN06269301_2531 [Geobacter sp. DSM 9736]